MQLFPFEKFKLCRARIRNILIKFTLEKVGNWNCSFLHMKRSSAKIPRGKDPGSWNDMTTLYQIARRRRRCQFGFQQSCKYPKKCFNDELINFVAL